MKNFRKSIFAVLTASMMLTGCGQIVQNMQDIPVMNEQPTINQEETQPSEDNAQASTSSVGGYVAGGVVTTSSASE
ncbi:MAG: hypothetical protein K2J44_05850, partial [Ruminococcus sp.]|nr:hypothetical protein [Ruminococcus sp.]